VNFPFQWKICLPRITPCISVEKTGGLSSDVREMGNVRYKQKVRARYKSSIERTKEIAVSQTRVSRYSHPVDFAADRRSTLLAARRAKSWLTESFFHRPYFTGGKRYLRIQNEKGNTATYIDTTERSQNR